MLGIINHKVATLCMLMKRGMAAAEKVEKEESNHQAALLNLKEEFQPARNQMEIFSLTAFRDRYHDIAIKAAHHIDLKCSYKGRWTDLSFIPQPGWSDLVCSCDMNVGVAVNTVKELSGVANCAHE